MRRAGSLLILLAVFGAALVPLLWGGKNTLSTLAHIGPSAYLAIGAAAMIGWVFRATKLWLLMQRMDLRAGALRTGAISLATEFAFLATPGGIGGYAAGVYYARSVGATLAVASSVTAADQLLDLIFFSVAMPAAVLGLVDAPLPNGLREAALVSCALLTVSLLLLLFFHRAVGRWLLAPDGPMARLPYVRRHLDSLREFGTTCSARLRELARGGPGFLLALAACTTLQWLIRYGLLWLILGLLGHNVSFALLLLLQGIVLHAAAWTGVPSGGGGADLGLAATLAPFVDATTLATALLLWRFATLYLPLLAGGAAVLGLRQRTLAPQPALVPR
jgi:uncharacterized protein (TIRG00374 family)